MKRLARIGLVVAAAILVAACPIAGGLDPRPDQLTNDLRGACIQAEAAYEGFDNICIIRKKCPPGEVKNAKAMRSDYSRLCATGDEKHRPVVLGIAKNLQALKGK